MSANPQQVSAATLSSADLISNRALKESDADDFGYAAISGRVAESILALDPPLTIGLFGPWGSGKSSMYELLRRDFASLDRSTRLVSYDASTYGGEALQRNFISHIASQLEYKDAKKDSRFHGGLYESRRHVSVDFKALKETARLAVGLFALVWFGFLLVSCLLAGLASLGTDQNFLGQVGETLPRLIAPAAVGGLFLALFSMVIKGATVEADQSRPASDEAFANCFRELVEQGRKDGKFNRLVVFVDELDRCSSKDVVATLTAIRTFLNQDHAVFIVAADRAALEQALEKELPQPTPVDEESPYYSSASSFFDKVFHDRVPLPPLRESRLSEWAFEKVVDRGGYWAALREGSDPRSLRRVLFFLIPSHVRAPRRVKVLLNAFVRSAAIAAHSGFDWQERAREIAKLTAFDVEFPSLGADLRSEPRLPELLLEPPKDPSERVVRLLTKHGADQISRRPGGLEESDPEDDGSEPADPILAKASEGERRALIRAEHENLRRYLARTQDVKIGRDLLFLDRAGAAVGLDDVELAELLDEAVDVPSNVVDALQTRDDQTRQLATRVLADMVEREFGEERVNVMNALMGTVALLGDMDEIADAVAGSITSYTRDEILDQGHLADALSVAVTAAGFGELETEILKDERLLSDPDTLVKATALLPKVPNQGRHRIYEAIAATIPDGGDHFLQALRQLSGTVGAELVKSEPVYSAVFRYVGPDAEETGAHDQLIEGIYEIAEEKGAEGVPLGMAAHRLLLKEEIAYVPFQRHAERILSEMERDERDLDILLALLHFGHRDSEFWLAQLSDGDYASPEHGLRAAQIVITQLRDVDLTAEDEPALLLSTIDQLAPFLVMSAEEQYSELQETLRTRLSGAAWWSDETVCAAQKGLHQVGHALAALGTPDTGELHETLADDLRRAPVDAPSLTKLTTHGLTTMGGKLGRSAGAVLEMLAKAEDEGNSVPVWTTRARVALALAARQAGAAIDASVVSKAAMVDAATQDSDHGKAAVADWLRLGPSVESVSDVLVALQGRSTPALESSAEAWCEEATGTEATALAKRLLGGQQWERQWLDLLVAGGIEELSLVEHIADQIREASQGSRRQELADTLTRIHPVDPAAQKAVADLMVRLTGSGKQVDFKAAIRMIPALGTEHRSARRLRGAFQGAAEEDGFQLSERAAVQLAEAGVKVPKKAVKKGVWGSVKDLFR
ncbi:MAG: P-loop NTPase fold protein [Actinomycetota bacterium]